MCVCVCFLISICIVGRFDKEHEQMEPLVTHVLDWFDATETGFSGRSFIAMLIQYSHHIVMLLMLLVSRPINCLENNTDHLLDVSGNLYKSLCCNG